ncbi:CDK5 regulatory subunit-associated protein 3 [Frankliniella fusca]|uniref:CDK5 regulatory subunit-associated protein 3 n=1 Tax=Frankliniella fusca TaxID=407009 RepID=A0AAE1LPT9_9NEOP|nr:CDK5 regulatory subunit-associated protein 3 [Frankliniella fusca]
MQDQFIPIDIHTNKLPDWLVSRRHCIRDWQPQVQLIREKINNAIQDMPVHEGITRLLSGTHINYFHCLKIIDILKETEADSRNVFGRYGSQRMKDWQEIVKLYEKDNVYLSEAAQMLCRNVQYEVPSIKKQIAKCEQMQSECDRRETELKKQENSARNDFNSSCQKLGISGKNIRKELVERCYELPRIYDEMALALPSLSQAAKFYKAFMHFMCGSDNKRETVPLLLFMIENGNTTTYEWIHKEKPLRVEEPAINISVEDEEEKKDDVIDFGDGIDFGEIKLETGGIDFGDDVKLETGDIDWGTGDGIQIESISGGDEIDFNISLEESGIEVQGGGLEGGVASGSDALALFDNPVTRINFMNDLLEVESFLKMRLHEMKSGGNDLLSLAQLQNAESFLQVQTTDSVQKMLSTVQTMIVKINDPTLYHLHNIRHSPRYVDNLAVTLKQKLSLVDKSIAMQSRVREKRAEHGEMARDLRPKLDLVISKTKELQSQIEEDISKKYKGRPVNIMGGINTL